MERIRKAVTLAAGRGTRMQNLTEDCPKPMLPLAGRPMLAHQIERLEQAGVEDVLVIVGYRADVVRDYFERHPPATARLSYVAQTKQDGTGSAAKLAREFCGSDPFLLTYGDILVDAEAYTELFRRSAGTAMTLAVKYVDDPYQGGAVYTAGDRVTKIIEKPPQGTSTTHWHNAGIYVFRPSVFGHLDRLQLSPRGEYELTDAVHSIVDAGEPVGWFAIEGHWRDVGRPEDLPFAERFVTGGRRA